MFNFSGSGGIRWPIRSRLCKYTPRVYWIHFCNNKQEEAGKILPLYFFKEMRNDRIVFSHLLFVSSFVLISTHRLCRGRRFDWLQYASTKTDALFTLHATVGGWPRACLTYYRGLVFVIKLI